MHQGVNEPPGDSSPGLGVSPAEVPTSWITDRLSPWYPVQRTCEHNKCFYATKFSTRTYTAVQVNTEGRKNYQAWSPTYDGSVYCVVGTLLLIFNLIFSRASHPWYNALMILASNSEL